MQMVGLTIQPHTPASVPEFIQVDIRAVPAIGMENLLLYSVQFEVDPGNWTGS